MDVFDNRSASAMLIADAQTPFNSPNYIYEIKFDGIRCLAYLDKEATDLRNKRNKMISLQFPELLNIHKSIKKRCILDGEIIVVVNGKPDFFEVQKRTLMNDPFKIKLSSTRLPACFVVYDILYYDDHEIIDLPIEDRKKLIDKNVNENQFIAISKIIRNKGIELFNATKEQGLEGVVAKRLGSTYIYGKRSKQWIKFKYLLDDDFVICGYIRKENHMKSLILGQYNDSGDLIYKGHVTLGTSLKTVFNLNPTVIDYCPFRLIPSNHENAIWFLPKIVGIVQFMPSDKKGLRQPVFKGIRNDKLHTECKTRN